MSDEHPIYINHDREAFIRKEDATENRELRELIEQWRDGTLPREGTFNQAADQLEDVIDS